MADKPAPKDRLTMIHQWITVLAVPAGLAVAGWIGLTFDAVRTEVTKLDVKVDYLFGTIQGHTKQLEDIEQTLNRQSK